MAKTYLAQDQGGTYNPNVTAPPAAGPTQVLVYQGPSLGNAWNYSGAVNGTTTFYVVLNGPSLGKGFSAS